MDGGAWGATVHGVAKSQKRLSNFTHSLTQAYLTLPKEAKDLYLKSYKILMKEIKDDTNRWKDIPCSWIKRLNIEKITILLQQI